MFLRGPWSEGRTALGLPENALDVADGRAIDLGDFGNRHAVLHPGPNAREL